MKILIINPNISDEVTDLIGREARAAALPETELTLVTAPFGVAYIESRAEAAIGAYAAMTIAAERHQDHDAVIVAAFGDPGLLAVREIMPVPVVGLTEAALVTACMMGKRYSVIAITRRITAWYRETIAAHGLLDRMASIRSLDTPPARIGHVSEDRGEQLVALAEAAVRDDGADVLILAGAPLAGLARTVASRMPVPCVDGVSSAVAHAELLAGLPSAGKASAGSFALPPAKPCRGLPPALATLVGRQPLPGS